MQPRVLICSEFSQIGSGYGIYTHELLKGFVRRGIEVAELAAFCRPEDERIRNCQWQVFPVLPHGKDEKGWEVYNSNPGNSFGKHLFEQVLLEYKPTHVINPKDVWTYAHEFTSPFRDFYAHVIMPAVDSNPQNKIWLDMYSKADGIVTYCDWATDLLKSYGLTNVFGAASPVPPAEFRPLDNKDKLKQSLNLGDVRIIGNVMRNQPRKAFPELFRMFRRFLDSGNYNDVYLYCHTSYPDVWELDELLLENNVGHKVLFTYACSNCKYVETSFYKGAMTACINCGQKNTLKLPSPSVPISQFTLNQIYNLFDLYIQYAHCFDKETDIYTEQGWKRIVDVKAGEKVLTHKGNIKPVSHVFKNKLTEKIYEISLCCRDDKIKVTESHPVLAITHKMVNCYNRSLRSRIGDLLRDGKDIPEPKFIEISELKKGDILVSPNFPIKNQKIIIDYSKYIINKGSFDDKYVYLNNKQFKYDRYLEVDNELAWFFGLYAADGYSDGHVITITSHETEYENRQKIEDLFNRLGIHIKHTKEKRSKAYNTYICHTLLARYLQDVCSKKLDKCIPDSILDAGLDIQKSCAYGLLHGDGHVCASSNSNFYVTISHKLSSQFKIILNRLHVNYNCCKVKRLGNRKDNYRFEVNRNTLEELGRTKAFTLFQNNEIWYKVKSIKEIKDYKDKYVYTLEVQDDHSYVTRIGAVKNCEGYGLPLSEAIAAGVPAMTVNYSAMETFVKEGNAIPIDVSEYRIEAETMRRWAIPDESDAVGKIQEFFAKSKEEQDSHAKLARFLYGTRDFDSCMDVWIDAILKTKPKLPWDAPKKQFNIPDKAPFGTSNQFFAKWLILNVLQDPSYLGSYLEARLVRDLENGFAFVGHDNKYYYEALNIPSQRFQPFDQTIAYNHFRDNLLQEKIYWENCRV